VFDQPRDDSHDNFDDWYDWQLHNVGSDNAITTPQQRRSYE